MIQSSPSFCFCTYASGSVYRALANELLTDLRTFAPGVICIVFTDKPSDFSHAKNAVIFKHYQRGILCYHERRFAIAKALSLYESCIYLDADVRICAPVPQNFDWPPGITARSCTRMIHHIQSQMGSPEKPRSAIAKRFEFYQDMAHKLDLNIEHDEVVFVNEFLFAVTRDQGKEWDWLNYWDKLAIYSELNGHHKHPAYAMGLAAAKVGFPIHHSEMPGLNFFDDRIEQIRIAKGQADPTAKQHYFETQKRIENADYSRLKKGWNKIKRAIDYSYHTIRFRIAIWLNGFQF